MKLRDGHGLAWDFRLLVSKEMRLSSTGYRCGEIVDRLMALVAEHAADALATPSPETAPTERERDMKLEGNLRSVQLVAEELTWTLWRTALNRLDAFVKVKDAIEARDREVVEVCAVAIEKWFASDNPAEGGPGACVRRAPAAPSPETGEPTPTQDAFFPLGQVGRPPAGVGNGHGACSPSSRAREARDLHVRRRLRADGSMCPAMPQREGPSMSPGTPRVAEARERSCPRCFKRVTANLNGRCPWCFLILLRGASR